MNRQIPKSTPKYYSDFYGERTLKFGKPPGAQGLWFQENILVLGILGGTPNLIIGTLNPTTIYNPYIAIISPLYSYVHPPLNPQKLQGSLLRVPPKGPRLVRRAPGYPFARQSLEIQSTKPQHGPWNPKPTYAPKVCRIMAFGAIFWCFGLLFHLLFGSR